MLQYTKTSNALCQMLTKLAISIVIAATNAGMEVTVGQMSMATYLMGQAMFWELIVAKSRKQAGTGNIFALKKAPRCWQQRKLQMESL